MVSWLKKIVFVLVIAMAGLWLVTQLPFGQHYVKTKIEQAFRRNGVEVSIQHVDIVLPFFIKLHGISAKDPAHPHAPLLTCQTLIFSPLLVDLPLNRITLLFVRGQGIFADADAIERVCSQQNERSKGSPLFFSLAIPFLRLQSIHVQSHHLPSSDGGFDCSLRGRLFLSSDGSRGKTSLTITKNTPCSWPKKVHLYLAKNKRNFALTSTIYLDTDGLDHPKELVFGPDDRLNLKINGSLRENSSEVSLNAFEKISGTWALSCNMVSTPLFQDMVLHRSGSARGTISYTYGEELSGSCDDFQTVLTLGRLIQGPSDADGAPDFHRIQFQALRTLVMKAQGDIRVSPSGDNSLHCRLQIPKITVNDIAGSLEGAADFSLKDDRLVASASTSGIFTKSSEQIPLHFAGVAEIGTDDMVMSGDLVASLFRLSARCEGKDREKNLWTTLRCEDLSPFQPLVGFPLGGSAELNSHLMVTSKKSLLSISGNGADLLLSSCHCKSADVRLSTEISSSQNISFTTDLMGLELGPFSLDRGHISLAADPICRTLRLLEARAAGRFNQLAFDLFGSGEGQTNGQNGSLSIDRVEGKIGDESVRVEHPLLLEHTGCILSSCAGSLKIGQEGRVSGQWRRTSVLQGIGDLCLEQIPLTHIALGSGLIEAFGTFDGQCHYQATANNVIATGQAQAHIERMGVIGGPEGGVALGGTLLIDGNAVKVQACIAGMGIKEPMMINVSTKSTRIPQSPWIAICGNAPLHGTIKGDIRLSELLAGWMPEEAGFEAIIGCDFSVDGTVADPVFCGPLHLREGRIDLLPTGEVISDIQMEGALKKSRLSIDHLTATDDKNGSINGSGLVEVTEDTQFHWQADLDCADVEVVNLDYASVVADATLKLVGDCSSITISGSAKTKKALIDLAARFPSNVPEIDVTYRGEKPSQESPYNVFFDLSIDASNNTEIKGRGLSSTWDGRLHLGGEASHLTIEGILQCLQGAFTLSTKELTINEGSVILAGDLFKDSRLNVIADINLPSITAQVCLKGSLETPKVAIQSTPPKPDNEILSLILFNKEFGDISPLQSLQLANTAMTLQQSSGPFDLLDRVKDTFGIDIIDFGSSTLATPPPPPSPSNVDQPDTGPPPPDTQSDVSLRVGKYISEGVAVTVSKNVTADANYLGLEAELAPEITAGAEVGDDQEGIVSLKWKKDY